MKASDAPVGYGSGGTVVQPGDWQPADMPNGMLAWAHDPAMLAGSTVTIVNGTIYVTRVPMRAAASVGKLYAQVEANMAGGVCRIALYNSALTTKHWDVNGTTAFGNYVGVDAFTLPGGPFATPAGVVCVALAFNVGTKPSLQRVAGAGTAPYQGQASGTQWRCHQITGHGWDLSGALPATLNTASIGSGPAPWVGLGT